ncbi:response regulator [uncultured Metabacillus sp.]|uniref:response regulator n=1 Tax=uncultured Metabacillus sp. TaxID=2860135 RepID=UPI00262D5A18|nr:response regulator [uncultured Metabacillus sp.]
MKIVIVDDEMIERKAMKKLIEESFSHMKVVGEAANGRFAIKQAIQHKPDVMIMDIHMPGIDGLEAIRQILQELPKTKFIMVSAYNSFEYAKEAMKQGVKEYILKPSNKQETLEAIIRVEKEINEEKRELFETEKMAKQHLITAMMQNECTEETETMYKKHYPTANMAFFQVITTTQPESVSKWLNERAPCPYIKKDLGDKLIVLFITEKKSAHHVKADALTIARAICQTLPSSTTIGIGSPFAQLDKLSISYQQALLASAQLKKDAHVSYGYPLVEENVEDGTFIKLEKSLMNEIKAGRLEQANDYFLLYYDYVSKETEEKNIIPLLGEWGIRLKQSLEQHGVFFRDLQVLEAKTKDDFLELIRQFCEKIILQKEENDSIMMAKTYIHTHYKESLSLEDVAEYVKLTPTYFTKVFKEQTKRTFIDYVTDYRIEKAKELLLHTKLSLKEIAFEVGYKDPNYFSRVFKKWTNCSPKQYRSFESTTTK